MEIRNQLGGVLPDLTAAIARRIEALEEWKTARSVMLYIPIPGKSELDLIGQLAGRTPGTVLVPLMEEGSDAIRPVVYQPEKLKSGRFGVLEPIDTVDFGGWPDLVVCPALAADRRGYRLGYGRGFYDRFLAAYPGFSVCAVPDILLWDELPSEPHDQPVKMVVTEAQSLRMGPR